MPEEPEKAINQDALLKMKLTAPQGRRRAALALRTHCLFDHGPRRGRQCAMPGSLRARSMIIPQARHGGRLRQSVESERRDGRHHLRLAPHRSPVAGGRSAARYADFTVSTRKKAGQGSQADSGTVSGRSRCTPQQVNFRAEALRRA